MSPSTTPAPEGEPEIIDITPLISERIGVWPGDVAYKRTTTSAFGEGGGIDLSSIQTTLHLGAHADSPSHYNPKGDHIDQRPLYFFYGPCQVVHTPIARATAIRPEDISQPITQPRVLFRTDSFPDPDVFNTDFVSFSPEVIDYLAAKGVITVGIDTPSVDVFHSRGLPAHQRLLAHDMANIEGIVLSEVDEGTYTLIALPLKIEGGDAGPLRAALVRL